VHARLGAVITLADIAPETIVARLLHPGRRREMVEAAERERGWRLPWTDALGKAARCARATPDELSVIIAHRLSTVIGALRVIVLDHGRVVQSGTHAALMAQERIYRKLVERQFVAA
jgi:hypothetical protein